MKFLFTISVNFYIIPTLGNSVMYNFLIMVYSNNQNVYVLKMTFGNKCHFLKNDNLGTTGFIISVRHYFVINMYMVAQENKQNSTTGEVKGKLDNC